MGYASIIIATCRHKTHSSTGSSSCWCRQYHTFSENWESSGPKFQLPCATSDLPCPRYKHKGWQCAPSLASKGSFSRSWDARSVSALSLLPLGSSTNRIIYKAVCLSGTVPALKRVSRASKSDSQKPCSVAVRGHRHMPKFALEAGTGQFGELP
ncbi:hypothetical protein VTI74DRAFT_427 [Chaetomium olivicolor]